MMLQWLSLLTFPACAVASALVVGVVHRHDELEDGALLRRFIVVLAIGIGLLYTTMQRPSVQLRLHPELRLQADIEADPIYKTLAHIGPEYAERFRAVLTTERVTSDTLPQARLQTRSMLTALATERRLGFADQATRIAWGQVTLDTLRELKARNPEQCYAVLSGQALDRETLAHGFSAQNTTTFEAAALQVLLESPGIETPGKGLRRGRSDADRPADFNATMLEYQGIQNEVAQVFGPEVSALLTNKRLPQSPPMSADTVCSARIYQLDAMLKRPKATAALLIDSALR
jgi:hypothetical protein